MLLPLGRPNLFFSEYFTNKPILLCLHDLSVLTATFRSVSSFEMQLNRGNILKVSVDGAQANFAAEETHQATPPFT